MRSLVLAAALAVIASPVLAGNMRTVPEMDGGAAIAAIALLVGAAAIIRERTRRK